MIAGVASGSRPYHHGNLRPALISAAIGEIEESGPAAMSLRAVARRAGVTHAAATYHFGDRAGLLTAVAAEGYRLLAEALRGAQETRGSFLEVGVAYVRFAVTHRAHFEVMYRPELYHRDNAELGRAREAAATLLYGTGEITRERMAYGVAAWSIVHGLATLWLNGNLPAQLGDDPEEITRVVAAHLDPPRRDPALAGNRARLSAAASQTARTGEESSCRTSGPTRKLRPERDLLRGPRPRKAQISTIGVTRTLGIRDRLAARKPGAADWPPGPGPAARLGPGHLRRADRSCPGRAAARRGRRPPGPGPLPRGAGQPAGSGSSKCWTRTTRTTSSR
jgi:AcrR family transcriptional regulator